MRSQEQQDMIAWFAAELRELRVAAGKPSYAELAKRSEYLPRATVGDLLTGKAAPRLAVVLEFVAACTSYATEHRIEFEAGRVSAERWQRRWERLHQKPAVLPPASSESVADVPLPNLLPRAPSGFVGRHEATEKLNTVLDTVAPDELPLVVVSGPGGAGKTALVTRWARGAGHRFAAGVLFVDLRGFSPGNPVDASAALTMFVRALRPATTETPASLDELVSVYRSLTASRPLLVIIDNAASVCDVRLLLPTGPRSMCVVTSRSHLAGLTVADAATPIVVGPLPEPDARQLLSLRAPGVSNVESVIRVTGSLPLGLLVAAHRLATADTVTVAALLTESEDPQSDLATVFATSYERLSPAAQRLLAIIAGMPGRTVGRWLLTALSESSDGQTDAVLAELVDAFLIEPDQHGRVGMHDLLRGWGRGKIDRPDRTALLARVARVYLDVVDVADRIILPQRNRPPLPGPPIVAWSFPPDTTRDAVLVWLDAEFEMIAALIDDADLVVDGSATHLAHVLLSYLNIRKPWRAWITVHRTLLDRADGSVSAELCAHLHLGLGIALRESGDHQGATASFNQAGRLYLSVDQLTGAAMAFNNEATSHTLTGRPDLARERLLQAARSLDAVDDRWRLSIVLHNLAEAELELGHLADALIQATRARTLCASVDDALGEAAAMNTLAEIHARNDEFPTAMGLFQGALMIQENNDRHPAAITHQRLADLFERTGDVGAANTHRRFALEIFDEFEDPRAASLRDALGKA